MNLEMLNDFDRELVTNLLEAIGNCDNDARLMLLRASMYVEPSARVPIYEGGRFTPEGDVLGAWRELLLLFNNPSVQAVVPQLVNEDSEC